MQSTTSFLKRKEKKRKMRWMGPVLLMAVAKKGSEISFDVKLKEVQLFSKILFGNRWDLLINDLNLHFHNLNLRFHNFFCLLLLNKMSTSDWIASFHFDIYIWIMYVVFHIHVQLPREPLIFPLRNHWYKIPHWLSMVHSFPWNSVR